MFQKSLDRLSFNTMDLLEVAKKIENKGDSLNIFYNKEFNKTELSKEFGVLRVTIYR